MLINVICVGHGSVLRCLFAYLKGLAPADIPKVMIQRGDLVEIAPVRNLRSPHNHVVADNSGHRHHTAS